MPEEERISGILVDPMGNAEPIDAGECELLNRLLQIRRATDSRGMRFSREIYHLLWVFKNSGEIETAKQLAQNCAISYLQEHEQETDFDDHDGLLVGFSDKHFFTLNQEELETLVNTYKALQIGGWFAEWLDAQVAHIAEGRIPDDRHPSPLKIAGMLTGPIAAWQDKVDAAKRFAELRPDLVLPAPPAEPEAAVEAATPDASRAVPAKPRSSRASKKKAA